MPVARADFIFLTDALCHSKVLARFFRQQDSNEGDRSCLSIALTGAIRCSEFGATGYPDLVDDRIDLRIVARIKLAN